MVSFDVVWQRIVNLQGQTFCQKRGRAFRYRVCGNSVVPSTTNRQLARASVFRRHVGTALIRRDGLSGGLLESWASKSRDPGWAQAEDQLERDVSRHICSMPFLWLAVPSHPDGSSDRGRIERNSIALLSCLAGGPDHPSASWLGHHATSTRILQSGLWNSNHVDEDYDPGFLQLFANLAENAR